MKIAIEVLGYAFLCGVGFVAGSMACVMLGALIEGWIEKKKGK